MMSLDFATQRRNMILEIQRHAEESAAYTKLPCFSEKVLKAMMDVPRHEFIPESQQKFAYEDSAQSIGFWQTISQPFIVALMCEVLELQESDRVLEVGTGCGYHAAVLSKLCREVFSLEVIPELAALAAQNLISYPNVKVITKDGHTGLKEKAPFQTISIAAAADIIPEQLIEQLAPGGRMIVPIVNPVQSAQNLTLIKKKSDESIFRRSILPVVFVPFVKK